MLDTGQLQPAMDRVWCASKLPTFRRSDIKTLLPGPTEAAKTREEHWPSEGDAQNSTQWEPSLALSPPGATCTSTAAFERDVINQKHSDSVVKEGVSSAAMSEVAHEEGPVTSPANQPSSKATAKARFTQAQAQEPRRNESFFQGTSISPGDMSLRDNNNTQAWLDDQNSHSRTARPANPVSISLLTSERRTSSLNLATSPQSPSIRSPTTPVTPLTPSIPPIRAFKTSRRSVDSNPIINARPAIIMEHQEDDTLKGLGGFSRHRGERGFSKDPEEQSSDESDLFLKLAREEEVGSPRSGPIRRVSMHAISSHSTNYTFLSALWTPY